MVKTTHAQTRRDAHALLCASLRNARAHDGHPLWGMPLANARVPNASGLRLLGSSYKTELGNGADVLSAVVYMSPATESGFNLCPFATAGCAAACLGHNSGLLITSTSHNARLWKTALYMHHRSYWRALLVYETAAHVRTLGLAELIFSMAVARRFFREKLTRLELTGVALLAAGVIPVTLD